MTFQYNFLRWYIWYKHGKWEVAPAPPRRPSKQSPINIEPTILSWQPVIPGRRSASDIRIHHLYSKIILLTMADVTLAPRFGAELKVSTSSYHRFLLIHG